MTGLAGLLYSPTAWDELREIRNKLKENLKETGSKNEIKGSH